MEIGVGVGMRIISVVMGMEMGIKFYKLCGWSGDGDDNNGDDRGWGQNLSPCSSLAQTCCLS